VGNVEAESVSSFLYDTIDSALPVRTYNPYSKCEPPAKYVTARIKIGSNEIMATKKKHKYRANTLYMRDLIKIGKRPSSAALKRLYRPPENWCNVRL